MCGITGVFNYSQSPNLLSESILKQMTRVIAHRGPDDDGIYISPNQLLGFGFRRLAIIDLSPAGHQPMSNRDGSIWVVFNGEIHNHRDLRKDLDASVILFSMWTESIKHFAENGKGNMIFLDGSVDGMTRTMQELVGLTKGNTPEKPAGKGSAGAAPSPPKI